MTVSSGAAAAMAVALLSVALISWSVRGESDAEPVITLPDGDGWVSFVIAPDADYRLEFEMELTYSDMSSYWAFDYNWTDPYSGEGGSTPRPGELDIGGRNGEGGTYLRMREPIELSYEGGSLNESYPPIRKTLRVNMTPYDLPRGFLFIMAGNGSFDGVRVLAGTVKASAIGEDAAYVGWKEFERERTPDLAWKIRAVGSRRMTEPFTVEVAAERPFFGAFAASEVVEPNGQRIDFPNYRPWEVGPFRESQAGTYLLNFRGDEAGDLAYWVVFPRLVTGPMDWWTPAN